MAKRTAKKKQSDAQQIARKVLDFIVPDAEPAKAKKPARKRDAADVERAESEGMAQPQGTPAEKNPAAVALGRLGGLKGGKARAEKLSAKKRSEIAKKAATARWKKPDYAE
jgi:hypothetical protein